MHSFFFIYISNSHSHSHFYIRGHLFFVTFVIASQSFYLFTFLLFYL